MDGHWDSVTTVKELSLSKWETYLLYINLGIFFAFECNFLSENVVLKIASCDSSFSVMTMYS